MLTSLLHIAARSAYANSTDCDIPTSCTLQKLAVCSAACPAAIFQESNLWNFTAALQLRLTCNRHDDENVSDCTACAIVYASLDTPLDVPGVCDGLSMWHLMCLQESSYQT